MLVKRTEYFRFIPLLSRRSVTSCMMLFLLSKWLSKWESIFKQTPQTDGQTESHLSVRLSSQRTFSHRITASFVPDPAFYFNPFLHLNTTLPQNVVLCSLVHIFSPLPHNSKALCKTLSVPCPCLFPVFIRHQLFSQEGFYLEQIN